MRHPQSIVITGASSGIGAALARLYAGKGITLGLLGRNAGRLQDVADSCRKRGAMVETGTVDVCDDAAMRQWLAAFDVRHPVDLLIANAGVAATFSGEGESDAQVREMFSTNIGGVINSALPVIPLMRSRRRGQIAIISSLAGIRGLPSCPAYSASKNAVRALGEGWRGALKADGVSVSVVCPGFIRTPMTDGNAFPMPFILSAERAAGIIARGLAAGRGRIAFPLLLYIPLWLISCISTAITDPLFAILPRKRKKS